VGTNYSALRCLCCDSSPILPNTEDVDGVWKCTECPIELTKTEVTKTLTKFEQFVDGLCPNIQLDEVDEALQSLEEELWPDNYIVIKLKEKFLKTQKEDDPSNLSGIELERRISFAEDVLRVKGKLESGQTAWMKNLEDKLTLYKTKD